MLASRLISSEWRILTNLEKDTIRGKFDESDESWAYSETDVDNFIEIIFRNVAEELGTKYNNIKDILYGRNISFFEEKSRIFSEDDTIDESEINHLLSKITIPNTYYLGNKTYAEQFVLDFEYLNIKDKVEVLEALGKMRISLPDGDVRVEDFIVSFNRSSKVQQLKLLKCMLESDIVVDSECQDDNSKSYVANPDAYSRVSLEGMPNPTGKVFRD